MLNRLVIKLSPTEIHSVKAHAKYQRLNSLKQPAYVNSVYKSDIVVYSVARLWVWCAGGIGGELCCYKFFSFFLLNFC